MKTFEQYTQINEQKSKTELDLQNLDNDYDGIIYALGYLNLTNSLSIIDVVEYAKHLETKESIIKKQVESLLKKRTSFKSLNEFMERYNSDKKFRDALNSGNPIK